uniref:Uncharacterized protein n=1 Tax=Ciona savignyi TaxID=51511 RepID=H2YBR7_CIOSA
PAHPEVPHEAFYDGSVTGVKELFESFEDSLLPIDLQLLKYKKKDLHASHYHRTACRIFSNRKRVLRSHVVDGDPFTCPSKDIHQGKTPVHLPQDEIEQIHELENEDKSWLEERRKLRKGLNNLGLSTEWLSRKPDRNGVENRVLADLLRKQEPSQPIIQEFDCPHNISRIIRLMADHIETFEMLPSIFPNCNRTKRISKANCKDGMLKLQKVLPISPVDIREIVNYFYEETRNSLWKVLVSAVKQSDSIKVGQSVHSVESDWTLSSLDEEEFPQIELKLTEKEKVKATRMKEYESAVQACKEYDTVLSEGLLRKVLLHPGDSGSDARSTMQLPQPGNT